jgi:hypothetical protein
MDRSDKRPGGGILVVIPSEDSAKFAKKYGTDFDGRSDMTTLRGLFMVAGGGREHGRPGIWVVDTTGKFKTLLEERRVSLPDDAAEPGGGFGGPGGPGGPGRPRRGL